MNLTSRSRYALKIMMDLAFFGATSPLVRRNEIASRQGVPTDYLDQIMVKLRAGGLVESIRGRSGGYKLGRPSSQITMWDLFSAVEESMIPVDCIASGQSCDFESSCSSKEAWTTIFRSIRESLSRIKLEDLVRQWSGEGLAGRELTPHSTSLDSVMALAQSVQECRGGGRAGVLHG